MNVLLLHDIKLSTEPILVSEKFWVRQKAT